MQSTDLKIDVKARRKHACPHIDQGAVTAGCGADRIMVLNLLNDALATEIACVLRYRRHPFMAKGIHSKRVVEEVLAHADERADRSQGAQPDPMGIPLTAVT